MVVKLSKTLKGQQRRIPLGFEIAFNFKPFGFAQYKEVEAWAHRRAKEKLSDTQQAALAGMELEELGDEFKDRIVGLAAQMILDRLVSQFCVGWEGVEEFDEDLEASVEMPFNFENWEVFRDELPLLVEILEQQLRNPMHVVTSEGNVSAPSLNGSAGAA